MGQHQGQCLGQLWGQHRGQQRLVSSDHEGQAAGSTGQQDVCIVGSLDPHPRKHGHG